ncbi:MAG: hypothetical protein ACC742_10935 [Thermoanaerobaculales bacterium]
MRLLVAIIHREELLDEVLSALVEIGAPDAVVVESRSGLELLERDLPIFAGLRTLVPGGIDFSRLVLCLIEDEQLAAEALAALRRLGESSAEPRNTAMLVPVTGVEFF